MIENVRLLFKHWKAWFKNKMNTKDDFDWSFEMVLVWAKYLTKHKTTRAEFFTAKDKSFDLEWLPNNAGEFLRLARTRSSKPYPPASEAFDIAVSQSSIIGNDVKRDWKHPVVLETANRIGWNKLKNCRYGFERIFTEVYDEVVAEFEAGANFVIPETKRLDPPKVVDPLEVPELAERWNKLLKNRK